MDRLMDWWIGRAGSEGKSSVLGQSLTLNSSKCVEHVWRSVPLHGEHFLVAEPVVGFTVHAEIGVLDSPHADHLSHPIELRFVGLLAGPPSVQGKRKRSHEKKTRGQSWVQGAQCKAPCLVFNECWQATTFLPRQRAKRFIQSIP